MSAHIEFDPALGEMHINLSAMGDKHRFWFDLETEDYVTAIKGMLEVFDRMVREATGRQNAKTRDWWSRRKSADNPDPSE